MAKKPMLRAELREVKYSQDQWHLLAQLRKKAMPIMEALQRAHIETTVHGSIARGDVNAKSDIDIVIPVTVPSFTVENTLEKANIAVTNRVIVQATPTYAMKAYFEIGEKTGISFPLMQMRKTEREFYKFGGEAGLKELLSNARVPGVDKRLMLVEPTEKGHRESTIAGHEEQTARLLKISVETVSDRVHALTKRDNVGRTGVFIKRALREDETFEMAMNRLADQNPAVRRRLRR